MTATGDMLTIATVALEHLDIGWRGRAFVAHRAADASAGEGSFDHKKSAGREHGVLPVRLDPEPTTQVSQDDYSFWVADEVGRLLAAPDQNRKPRCLSGATLRRLCRGRKIPHATALGAAVGTNKITAWYWWNGKAVPSLPMALRICRRLDIHLSDALYARSLDPSAGDAEPIQLNFHLSARARRRKLPWAGIRAKLLQEIGRPLTEARSLLAVSRELDVSTRTLRAHEPDLCRKIGRRYVEAGKQAAQAKYTRLREQIEQACVALRERGSRITSARVADVLGQPGLFCRPAARRALAEVLRLDYCNWLKTITVPGMVS